MENLNMGRGRSFNRGVMRGRRYIGPLRDRKYYTDESTENTHTDTDAYTWEEGPSERIR